MGLKARKQPESQYKNTGGRTSTPRTDLRNERIEFSDNEYISEDDQEDEALQDTNANSNQETNLPSTSKVVGRTGLGKREVPQDPARVRTQDTKTVTVDDVTSPKQKLQEKVHQQTLPQQIFTRVFMSFRDAVTSVEQNSRYQLIIILACVALTNIILLSYLINKVHVSDSRQTYQTSYRSNEKDNSIDVDTKVRKAVDDKFDLVNIGGKVQKAIDNKLADTDIDSKVKQAIGDELPNAINKVHDSVSSEAESVLRSPKMTDLIKSQVSENSVGIESNIETSLSSKIANALEVSLDKKVETLEEAFSGIAEMRNSLTYLKAKREDSENAVSSLQADYELIDSSINKLSEHYTKVSEIANSDSGKIIKLQKTLKDGDQALDNMKRDLKTLEQTISENERLYKDYKDKVQQLDEISSKLDVMQPNIFNKDSFIMAFMILMIIVFALAISVYNLYQRQNIPVRTGGQTTAKQYGNNMVGHDILRKIPNGPDLEPGVCIISFDEARTETHKRLLDSANIANCRVQTYVVRRHKQIPDIPRSTVYLMCTEFSERHVIIEEPGKGLGDLHKTTYDAVLILGGCLIILYTRDPGSRNLKDQSRYNRNIYCVTHQPELSTLEQDGRFFSVYDNLTAYQRNELRRQIAENMNKD